MAVPRVLEAKRLDETKHQNAEFVLREVGSTTTGDPLPVAALGLNPGECVAVFRAKRRRPAVVLATSKEVPKADAPGVAWQRHPMALVAPYFGVDAGGTRGGWPPEFVQRIRHLHYAQFQYDRLPIGGAVESICRLDQLQPMGLHYKSYELTPWKLSASALELLQQQLDWLRSGKLKEESELGLVRNLVHEEVAALAGTA
ncbi:MAG: hypothetical protein JNM69_06810 [Archangium sp.]|nr:hypothetical protein [Archangium sp.]